MAKRKKTTLGKVILAIGLLWHLVSNVLLILGITVLSAQVPSIIGVCLLAGGFVVYALERHKGEQRFFAILGAVTVMLSLIETTIIKNTAAIIIILTVQLLCPSIILIIGRSGLKRTFGTISLLLALFVCASGFGWITVTAFRAPEIAICAIYALTGIGMII